MREQARRRQRRREDLIHSEVASSLPCPTRSRGCEPVALSVLGLTGAMPRASSTRPFSFLSCSRELKYEQRLSSQDLQYDIVVMKSRVVRRNLASTPEKELDEPNPLQPKLDVRMMKLHRM